MELALEQPLLIAVRAESLRRILEVGRRTDPEALHAPRAQLGHVGGACAHRRQHRRIVDARGRRFERLVDLRLEARRRANLAAEVFSLASSRAGAHLQAAVAGDPELQRLLAAVEERQLDPLSAVRRILEDVFRFGPELDGGAS